jgi:hypothetical protein
MGTAVAMDAAVPDAVLTELSSFIIIIIIIIIINY